MGYLPPEIISDICPRLTHRRNHHMEPVGRVPSNFGDHGDQLLIPSTFCNHFCYFSLGTVRS